MDQGVNDDGDYHAEMVRVKDELGLDPGDIYEDCSFDPIVCVGVGCEQDDIWGISFIDGSFPRLCRLRHCEVSKLTPAPAWQLRLQRPAEDEDRERISPEKRWWVSI